MRSSKLYILDTNVLLHDPNCLTEFKEQDIAIPMTVLEELDQRAIFALEAQGVPQELMESSGDRILFVGSVPPPNCFP